MGETISNILVLIACYPLARWLVQHQAKRRTRLAALEREDDE